MLPSIRIMRNTTKKLFASSPLVPPSRTKGAPMRKLTREQERDIRAIAARRDEDIDFSDIPPVLDWSGAEIGKFYRPGRSPSPCAWMRMSLPGSNPLAPATRPGQMDSSGTPCCISAILPAATQTPQRLASPSGEEAADSRSIIRSHPQSGAKGTSGSRTAPTLELSPRRQVGGSYIASPWICSLVGTQV